MRWPVYLATRLQIAQVDASGIDEQLENMTKVHADIQALGAMSYWNAAQNELPISHRVFIRWVEAVENTVVVIRQTIRPDRSIRTEQFRVRRWKELGGRKRFVLLEVDEEKRES